MPFKGTITLFGDLFYEEKIEVDYNYWPPEEKIVTPVTIDPPDPEDWEITAVRPVEWTDVVKSDRNKDRVLELVREDYEMHCDLAEIDRKGVR